MKSISLLVLLLFCLDVTYAQHQDLHEKPKIWLADNSNAGDSTTLLSAFKSGSINGHFRFFHSSIRNQGDLSDYHANAIGGGLRYESGSFHGLRVGVSGFYIFNAVSSDLALKDNVTGQANRYEIGLFDIANPSDLNEINRIEELFLKYKRNETMFTFGRQLLNTPFINLQDGRMRPTSVEGIWFETAFNKIHHFQSGWIYGIAPRGTKKWYSLASSIGVYPSGVNELGIKSDYYGNIKTSGAFFFNYENKVIKNLTINFWDMWVQNIMNTALLQAEWQKQLTTIKFYSGVQLTLQNKSGDGGNSDDRKTYYSSNDPLLIYGARMGIKTDKWDHSLNFNHIGDSGRYLMPREWGRDNFYTFMSRERNEGFGGVTAVVGKTTYTLFQKTSFQLSYGYFLLPDVKNFELNKFGMPAYTQMNIDIRHKFSGLLNGFESQLLWVFKWKKGETYDDPRYVIHKVDMNLLNIVINFRF